MKSVLNGLSEVFVQHGNPVQKPDLLQTQVQGRGVPLTVVSPGLVGWSSRVSVVALSEGVPDVLWSSLPAPEHLRCPQLLLHLCAQFPLVSDLWKKLLFSVYLKPCTEIYFKEVKVFNGKK